MPRVLVESWLAAAAAVVGMDPGEINPWVARAVRDLWVYNQGLEVSMGLQARQAALRRKAAELARTAMGCDAR